MTIGLTLSEFENKHHNYVNWLKGTDSDIEVIVFSTEENNAEAIADCDALVLSGGVHSHPKYYNGKDEYPNKPEEGWNTARDDFERSLYQTALDKHIPILAVCRGHQLVNIFHGGNLVQDLGELNEFHKAIKDQDKQHTLVLVVTDVNGNRAVSGDQWDRNHRMEETYIGDRDNQGFYSYNTRKDGTYVLIGNNGATPWKRVPGTGAYPTNSFANDPILGAAGFDGGVHGEPEIDLPMTLSGQDGKTIPPALVGDGKRLLNTGDVQIGSVLCKYDFTDGVVARDVWRSLWRTEPTKTFTMEITNHVFSVDVENPLVVYLRNIRITLQHDCLCTFGEGRIVPIGQILRRQLLRLVH